jgi:hypothetical protein
LFDAENAILRELGFIIHAEHAHKFVLYYIRVMYGKTDFNPELAQRAWNYVNDSYRTVVCVRFRPCVLACGAIFLAARDLNIALPENPGWWTLFDTQYEDMLTVCSGILTLYQMPKSKYICLHSKDKKELQPAVALPSTPSAVSVGDIIKVEDTDAVRGSPKTSPSDTKRESSSEREKSGSRGKQSPGPKEEKTKHLELLERLEERREEERRGDRRDKDTRDRSRDHGRGDRARCVHCFVFIFHFWGGPCL